MDIVSTLCLLLGSGSAHGTRPAPGKGLGLCGHRVVYPLSIFVKHFSDMLGALFSARLFELLSLLIGGQAAVQAVLFGLVLAGRSKSARVPESRCVICAEKLSCLAII